MTVSTDEFHRLVGGSALCTVGCLTRVAADRAAPEGKRRNFQALL